MRRAEAIRRGRSIEQAGGQSHTLTSKDAERNAATVSLRYKGKVFKLNGTFDYVTRDGDACRIAFKIPEPWEDVIRTIGADGRGDR